MHITLYRFFKMNKINIDPLSILEVKYLDMSLGKALTLGEVINMKQRGNFNKSRYTSVNQLVGDQTWTPPNLKATVGLNQESITKLGIAVYDVPRVPTPMTSMSPESRAMLDSTGIKLDISGQYDLDYRSLNKPADFRPNYSNITADPTILRVAAQTTAMLRYASDPFEEHTAYAYSEMRKVAETHFYGNGSFLGQIRRLAAVHEVSNFATRAIAAQSVNDPELKFGISDAELSVFMPLGVRVPIQTPTLKDILTNNDKKDQPTMNSTSEEGIPFKPHIKRESCMLYEAITLTKILNDSKDTDNVWGGIARLKPKSEVYSADDFEKKTRNIYVLNAGQTTLLSLYIHHLNKSVDDQPLTIGRQSLIKRPALTKMASEFAETVLEHRGDSVLCITYSDNLFTVHKDGDRHIVTSRDGSKMEGTNISTIMLDNFINYTLVENEPLSGLIKKHSRRTINSVAQIGDMLVQVSGMSSGTPLTTWLNSYTMGLLAADIQKTCRTEVEITNCASKHGIQLKTERAYDREEMRSLWENPTTLTQVGSYIDADLLGFSIGCIEVDGVKAWVSILDPTRLCKSMVFNKTEASQRYKGTIQLVIRYITMATLYMMGGWYYPGYANIIKASCIEIVEAINEAGKRLPISLPTINEIIASAVGDLGLDQTTVNALAAGLLKSTVPTLETILRIVAPKISTQNISNDIMRMGLNDKAHLILEPETFDKMGYKASPEQREYLARHSVFSSKVSNSDIPTKAMLSVQLTDPQRSGIKRKNLDEVETREVTAKIFRPWEKE